MPKPVPNPRADEYDKKIVTNIRLDAKVKERMKQEIADAKLKGRELTLSDIANEALRKRYGLE